MKARVRQPQGCALAHKILKVVKNYPDGIGARALALEVGISLIELYQADPLPGIRKSYRDIDGGKGPVAREALYRVS